MSISTVITLGYGSFGSVNLLPLLGYSPEGAPTPPAQPTPEGWASGSYVTQMTEAEFERRRKAFLSNLDNVATRMQMLKDMPDLHEALMARIAARTVAEARAREERISNIIAKRIRREHDAEARKANLARAQEAEDEDTILNFFLN